MIHCRIHSNELMNIAVQHPNETQYGKMFSERLAGDLTTPGTFIEELGKANAKLMAFKNCVCGIEFRKP